MEGKSREKFSRVTIKKIIMTYVSKFKKQGHSTST
jgi:hypothetical protein